MSPETFPGKLIPRPKPKEWRGQDFRYIQPKLDGWRITVIQPPDGGPTEVYGRDISAHLNLAPKLRHLKWFDVLTMMPLGSIVDGELCLPFKPASHVSTALAERAIDLAYHVFAVPWWGLFNHTTVDLPCALNRFWGWYNHFGVYGLHIVPTESRTDGVYDPKRVKDTLLARAVQRKLEGYVLKNSHYAHDWYKLKLIRTVDAFVTGFVPGCGKYYGQCGALRVSMVNSFGADVEVARISGMDDAERRAITSECLRRVCEVEYQEVTVHGRLRHPRFVRWRDDKPWEECSITQIGE